MVLMLSQVENISQKKKKKKKIIQQDDQQGENLFVNEPDVGQSNSEVTDEVLSPRAEKPKRRKKKKPVTEETVENEVSSTVLL